MKVRKDTFDSMNNVIKETKNAIEFQPKIQQLFNEVDNYAKSHQTLEKENQNLQKEIKALTTRNEKLAEENKHLKDYITVILEIIKKFFRALLQIGNNRTKEVTTSEIKEYYDNQDFSMDDVKDIAKGTSKENELFEYIGYEKYYIKDSEIDRDDFCI